MNSFKLALCGILAIIYLHKVANIIEHFTGNEDNQTWPNVIGCSLVIALPLLVYAAL